MIILWTRINILPRQKLNDLLITSVGSMWDWAGVVRILPRELGSTSAQAMRSSTTTIVNQPSSAWEKVVDERCGSAMLLAMTKIHAYKWQEFWRIMEIVDDPAAEFVWEDL